MSEYNSVRVRVFPPTSYARPRRRPADNLTQLKKFMENVTQKIRKLEERNLQKSSVNSSATGVQGGIHVTTQSGGNSTELIKYLLSELMKNGKKIGANDKVTPSEKEILKVLQSRFNAIEVLLQQSQPKNNKLTKKSLNEKSQTKIKNMEEKIKNMGNTIEKLYSTLENPKQNSLAEKLKVASIKLNEANLTANAAKNVGYNNEARRLLEHYQRLNLNTNNYKKVIKYFPKLLNDLNKNDNKIKSVIDEMKNTMNKLIIKRKF